MTPAPPSGVTADASVRPARRSDAGAIGAVHQQAWVASYSTVLPDLVVEALDAGVLAEAWRDAVSSPPSSLHRVLVATEGDVVTGFAAVAPSPDRDSDVGVVELVGLEVAPLHRGHGHGSRLLNAAVDVTLERGALRLVTWVPTVDGARAAFLTGAGFSPDGASRTRELAGRPGTWSEIRYGSSLQDAAPDPA